MNCRTLQLVSALTDSSMKIIQESFDILTV